MSQNLSLVIGGTGMLADATRWLMTHSTQMLLVARRADRFAQLEPKVTPISCDWGSVRFREVLCDALEAAPPITRALLWLHEPRPILNWLLPLLPNARAVLVLGSMDGNPELPAVADVVTVRLGSMATAHGRRWLTHEEISHAAIESLKDGQSRIVGALTPPY